MFKDFPTKITQKVKCPKKETKEKEETKYTLAFHAEGKHQAERYPKESGFRDQSGFRDRGCRHGGCSLNPDRAVVPKLTLHIFQSLNKCL